MAATSHSSKRRKISSSADALANGTASAKTPGKQASRRQDAEVEEQGKAEEDAGEGEHDDEEETAVRTSGRKRRLPKRLEGDIAMENLLKKLGGVIETKKEAGAQSLAETPHKSKNGSAPGKNRGKIKGAVEADEADDTPTRMQEPEGLVNKKTKGKGRKEIYDVKDTSSKFKQHEDDNNRDELESGTGAVSPGKSKKTPAKKDREKKTDFAERPTNHDRDELLGTYSGAEDAEDAVVATSAKDTPSKKRGRPKGSKNSKKADQVTGGVSMTIDGDLGNVFDDNEELVQAFANSYEHPAATQVAAPEDDLETSVVKDNEHKEFEVDDVSIETIRSIILSKLTGRRSFPLIGLDEEYKKVNILVRQTILAGEGNSMLIIGARGTGKSTLVNQVIREISKYHKEHFHVVRLNGFIHTDDRVALREIWRQLGREMQVEDDEQGRSYSDILAKLLALLSHPSELSNSETNETAKSVVFILDEFDLFALHPRQTLLYNLFDTAQSRKAPIAVLGLTTRVDIAESMEKRVKSRFSHRYVHLNLCKNFAQFEQICKSALQIDPKELDFNERTQLSQAIKRHDIEEGKTEEEELLCLWNSSIEVLLASTSIFRMLSRIYYTSKSVPEALTSFILPTSLLKNTSPLFQASSFADAHLPQPPDSRLHLLPSLPTLSLAMLIAAARLEIILGADTCNFNMAYDEYSTLAAKGRISAIGPAAGVGIGGKVWGRELAKSAWQRLLELDLLLPAVGTGRVGDSDMVRCDVALEEIEPAVPGLEAGLAKWCKEI